jgi:hypothetical protein
LLIAFGIFIARIAIRGTDKEVSDSSVIASNAREQEDNLHRELYMTQSRRQ